MRSSVVDRLCGLRVRSMLRGEPLSSATWRPSQFACGIALLYQVPGTRVNSGGGVVICAISPSRVKACNPYFVCEKFRSWPSVLPSVLIALDSVHQYDT